MEKKKIIYCITKSFWGGAQKYVYDLSTRLPKENFDVIVIAGGEGALIEKLQKAGIKAVSIPYYGYPVKIISEIRAFAFLLKIFNKENPDIVHLNSSKMGVIGAVAAKLAGVKKVVFTAHNWPFNEKRFFASRIILEFIMWFASFFQDKIITVSQYVAKGARRMPLASRKTVVIYNGIEESDLHAKKTSKEIISAKFGIPVFLKNKMWIGTVSELNKNKGLEYAIKAITYLREMPVIFVIIGEGKLRERLQRLIKKEKLEQKVFIAGYLDHARDYLLAFDIFLLSSINEALGYVLLEAGMAELPAVATKAGGIPEIIEDGKTGLLVKKKRPKQLAWALKKLIEDETLRKTLGASLKEKVQREFLLEKMFEQTLNLYR